MKCFGFVVLACSFGAGAVGAPPSPRVADTVVDLRTSSGASEVGARWRYTDAHVVEAEHQAPGPDGKPSGATVATHDIHPKVGTPDFESAPWIEVAPDRLEDRRTNGKLAFGWYRLSATLPDRIGAIPVDHCTIVLELVVDDYSEVWVNGKLPTTLGSMSPTVVGWNAPQRVVLTTNAQAGQRFDVSVFAANGPISAPPLNYIWVRSATLDVYRPGHGMTNEPEAVELKVERLDAGLDAIVTPGARAERLASGFMFTEGPVWVPRVDDVRYGGGGLGGYLLFSDPNQNVIHRWDPATGGVSIFRTKSGYAGVGGTDIGEYHQPGSNGLTLDGQGRLTICEHGNRRVTRLEPNGKITVIADSYEGKRLNSPNDLVYRSDGTLYFTDPPFGLPGVFKDPRKETPFSGVYFVRNGVVTLAAKDLAGPNGLAFSPDEKLLYVDNWDEARKVIMRYDVAADGTLGDPVVFADVTSVPGEMCWDGLKVDVMGNVYAAGPGGVWVFSAEGKRLGTLTLPEAPANFTFGDEDGKTLYCCARTGLYRIRLGVPGIRP